MAGEAERIVQDIFKKHRDRWSARGAVGHRVDRIHL